MPTRSGNENTAERRAQRDRAAIRAPELVDLVIRDSTLKPDIRYATTHNLLGRLVYPEAEAFLQRPAAESLVRIHRALQPRGCGLVVFDGYRPCSVTKEFWDMTPSTKGSRHNRACVVDVTLCTVADGREAIWRARTTRFPSGPHRDTSEGTLTHGVFGICSLERWKRRDVLVRRWRGGSSTIATGGRIQS